MKRLHAVSLFCSASPRIDPSYGVESEKLMRFLSQQQIELVYGGAHNGLMGVIADHMLKHGGRVRGIIPQILHDREVAHLGLTHLEVVTDLLQRKQRLLEAGDVMIVMPGGLGTLDELLEAMTWNYMGLLDKPVVLWNLKNFWEPFLNLLSHLQTHGMVTHDLHKRFAVVSSAEDLLEYLQQLL